MSDFTLTIGADVKTSLDAMRKDIADIVASLNAKPPKILVALDIDKGAKEALRKQIEEISKATGGASAINMRFGGADVKNIAGGMAQVAAEANKAAAAISGAKVAVGEMRASIDNVNTDKIQSALRGIEGVSRDAATQLAQNLSQANVQITSVEATLRETGEDEDKIVNLMVRGNDERGKTVKYLMQYDLMTQEIAQQQFKITENYQTTAKIAAETVAAEKRRNAELAQGYTLVNSIQASLDRYPKTDENRGGYESLAADVETLKTALSNATAKGISLTEALNELGATGNASVSRLKVALAGFNAGASDAERKTRAIDNSNKELADTFRTIDNLLQEININTTKWDFAKHGDSQANYEMYKAQALVLKEIEAQLEKDGFVAKGTADKINAVVQAMRANAAEIKSADENAQTLSSRLGRLTQKFSTWFSITRVIMAVYRAIRKMIANVVELDTAMTELKKVTDETNAVYNKFLVDAAGRAKMLGATMTDVVNATADFARLGYDIKAAEKLADAAVIYKNVGDGIESISDASESIIATMQAFAVKPEEILTVVDRFNEVGNRFAVSSKGIGEILLRSAAAMHAANNSLDETIALGAAAI